MDIVFIVRRDIVTIVMTSKSILIKIEVYDRLRKIFPDKSFSESIMILLGERIEHKELGDKLDMLIKNKSIQPEIKKNHEQIIGISEDNKKLTNIDITKSIQQILKEAPDLNPPTEMTESNRKLSEKLINDAKIYKEKHNKWNKLDVLTEDEHMVNLKNALSIKAITQEEYDNQMIKHNERVIKT